MRKRFKCDAQQTGRLAKSFIARPKQCSALQAHSSQQMIVYIGNTAAITNQSWFSQVVFPQSDQALWRTQQAPQELDRP